jgi:hypothetical protein
MMNHEHDEDPLDRMLRDAMQSQPEHPRVPHLALRAARLANNPAPARPRPKWVDWYSRCQHVVTIMAAALVGVMVWFAANHVTFPAAGDIPQHTITVVDQSDLLQEANSDTLALMSLGTLLLTAVVIAVQRAVSSEQSAPLAGRLSL